MIPPESHESDPFNTRPSQPLANFQTNWPGLDPSTPYPAIVDSTPPPPPGGAVVAAREKQRWTHSTQALAIGLLSVAVVLLSLVILSFRQGGIVGFFSDSTSSTSSSTTNIHNTTSPNNAPGSTNTSSGNSSTSSSPATATTAAILPPVSTPTLSTLTPTAVMPTATNTSVPAPTVTFTCQNVSGGQGTPGPRNVAQICVQTTPAAQLTIAATQCNGHPDNNLKQTGGTADSAGNMQWSWNMQDPGPCGQEHVTVTARVSSGQTGQNAIYLQFMH